MEIRTPSTLTSRFTGLPFGAVKNIQNSPEFNQPHIQQLLQQDTLEIRFQDKENGQGEIITSGPVPNKFVLDGFIKAALVSMGFKGKQVIPSDEPGDLFVKSKESQN